MTDSMYKIFLNHILFYILSSSPFVMSTLRNCFKSL